MFDASLFKDPRGVIFCPWLDLRSEHTITLGGIVVRSIKVMLLGISFMLAGLYIQGEPGIKLYGFEFLIVLSGFLLSVAGVFTKR
ncbi:MAG: hypothetical protein K0R47_6001 [Brevibacillus sp.]|nr:hypothetical protein [Brevibacillus sp.]